MNNRNEINQKKAEFLLDYMQENKNAYVGKRMVSHSIFIILTLRILLFVFEIPVFIVSEKPINLLALLFLPSLVLILYIIFKWAKGFTYIILVFAVSRLILYFSLVYKTMPDTALTSVYSFTLFGILLVQFALSLLIITSNRCDTYFTALQRINIKVHGDAIIKK